MEPKKTQVLEALVAKLLKQHTKPSGQAVTLDLSGVAEAARPYIISATPTYQSGSILIITSDNEHANIWANETRLWLKYFMADPKSLPRVNLYDELPESEQLSQIPSIRRYNNLGVLSRMLQNDPGFYVIPVRAFNERLPQVVRFTESTLKLKKGTNVTQSKLLKTLEEIGYEPESGKLTLGSFARRGELVEFFSPQYQSPIRLTFLGNRIESLDFFEPKSQKKISSVSEIIIIPLNLLLSQGKLINFITEAHRWKAIIDDPEDLINEIDPLGQTNEQEWKKIQEKLKLTSQIKFRPFAEKKNANSHTFNFAIPPSFRGNLASLKKEVLDYKNKKYQVHILSGDPEKIGNVVGQRKGVIIKEVSGTLRENLAGFRDVGNKFLVLTDREIYGHEAIAPPRVHQAKRFDQAFIATLEPGHYVVHVDHGIGRFLGMVRNLLAGIEKEYFVLQYAQGDRLYVPVEAAEKLSRYIGAANPAIHRLSETSWLQVKSQLKESTEKLAKELIKLYAKRQVQGGIKFKKEQEVERQFAKTFPFQETPDQQKAIDEISADLERDRPMDRLLVGDVGFGKTEVAMRAAFKTAVNERQCAILAPTTILADQHFKNFSKRFRDFPYTLGVLSRFQSAKEQRVTIAKIKAGTVDVVIGTHRLLSKDVEFKQLGMVIIDEEQRFGVEHKERLKKMRSDVHVLSLSATPIPRTLQFSLSGIRDISTIETPPPGRYPIETKVAVYDDKELARAIKLELKRDGQVYVLHNRIETIQAFAQKIASLVPEAKIRIGHGQLPEQELSSVMNDFYQHKYDVLVASTIIENGLDIPSVNTIIVDQSTHFGLSQLYQLRGRIGRGDKRAYAYMFYNRQDLKGPARRRLLALLEATELGSGFQVALRDLEIRGAGNLLGGEQSGQIKSVGLNMYLRLLQRAVHEVKTGKTEKPILDVTVDLPLAAYLPANYVNDERERLSMYQFLASLTDIKKLEQEKATLQYHHGPLPTQAENFFRLLSWKLIAGKAQVLSITTSGVRAGEIDQGLLTLEFVDQPPFARITEVLTKINPAWQLKDNTLRISIGTLGSDWREQLEKTLKVLATPTKDERKK